jgi:hypothetical protein
MAEDGPATPGWVEERLEEIWARRYLPATAAVNASRDAYLSCLAGCGNGGMESCHDMCRAECLAALRRAKIAPDTLAGLEGELEALEAELTDRTS